MHEADVQMGTLSKAAGSYGGYVCAAAEVIAFLENKARSLLFATGLPPASVAAAAAALADHAETTGAREEAARKRPAIHGGARREQPRPSPIVPVIVGEPETALAASAMLAGNGYLVVAIRPPSVPPGTARLRFAFSAMHEANDIERAAALLQQHGYA